MSIAPWLINHDLSAESDAGELTMAVLSSMLEPPVTVSVEEDALTPPQNCERARGRPQRLLRAKAPRSLPFQDAERRLPLG